MKAHNEFREAADDVREKLYALDVELSRETDAHLIERITSVLRAAHNALVKSLKLIHTSRKKL